MPKAGAMHTAVALKENITETVHRMTSNGWSAECMMVCSAAVMPEIWEIQNVNQPSEPHRLSLLLSLVHQTGRIYASHIKEARSLERTDVKFWVENLLKHIIFWPTLVHCFVLHIASAFAVGRCAPIEMSRLSCVHLTPAANEYYLDHCLIILRTCGVLYNRRAAAATKEKKKLMK